MTDLEKFINLYKSFGIDLVVEELETVTTVELNSNDNPKFVGYKYCGSIISFNKTDGKFLEQGFWEG